MAISTIYAEGEFDIINLDNRSEEVASQQFLVVLIDSLINADNVKQEFNFN